jgi:hypothetical protein
MKPFEILFKLSPAFNDQEFEKWWATTETSKICADNNDTLYSEIAKRAARLGFSAGLRIALHEIDTK